MIRAAALLAALALPARAEVIHFCWLGANGYTMVGQMELDPKALLRRVATERDVRRFRIAGYLDGELIGKWDLATAEPDDPWFLHFDTVERQFYPGAALGRGTTQGWNAGGTAQDCGPGGFGFNSGNFAQDFCLDGQWIEESGVAPDTPFLVQDSPPDPLCRSYVPLS